MEVRKLEYGKKRCAGKMDKRQRRSRSLFSGSRMLVLTGVFFMVVSFERLCVQPRFKSGTF